MISTITRILICLLAVVRGGTIMRFWVLAMQKTNPHNVIICISMSRRGGIMLQDGISGPVQGGCSAGFCFFISDGVMCTVQEGVVSCYRITCLF